MMAQFPTNLALQPLPLHPAP